MKRKFTFLIAAAMMLLTMVATTSEMWGQTRETKTEGFETATAATTYNSTATVATNQSDCGIGWSIYYGNVSTTQAITGNNSCLIRYYTADAVLGYAKTTTGIQGLSNITFNAKVTNTGNKMGVWYSTDGDNWIALATDVTLTASAASKSYDIPNSSSSNTYYVKIGLTTGSSTNKKDLIFDDVVFTYSTGGGSTVSTPTITPNGGSFIDSQEITLSCNTEEATIYYTLDGNDPTTSSTVYSTPFTITETKTVKAYAIKDGLTDSNIADATFTKVTPMTVAEALAASPTNYVYVTGIISTITEVNTGYHNATYRISDDGTTTSEMIVYRGRYLNNTDFTSEDQIQIGDVVVVTGNIINYNNANQLAQGNYLISLIRPEKVATPTFTPAAGTYNEAQNVTVTCATEEASIFYKLTENGDWTEYTAAIPVATTTTIWAKATKEGMVDSDVASAAYVINTEPTITVDPATVNAPYAGADGTLTVTYENITEILAEVWFCNAEGTAGATYDWITADINAQNNVAYLVEENDGAARTAYFKVYALDDKSNDVYSNLVTVTQAAYIVDYATLPFEYEGGVLDDFSGLTGTSYSLNDEGSYAQSNAPYRIKFTKTGDYLQVKCNEQPGIVTIGVKVFNTGNNSKITVQGSADGETFDDIQELTISASSTGTQSLETTESFDETHRYVRLKFTKGVNVGVGPITIAQVNNTPSITINPGPYNLNANGGDAELPVTYNNMPNDPQAEVVFFESNGETPLGENPTWITATINNAGNVDGHIDANTGAARSAYFKVKGIDANDNAVYSELVTINQAAYVLSIEFETASIDLAAGGESDRKLSFEYSGLGNDPEFSVNRYESDGTTPATYDWLTTEITDGNKVSITVTANTGAARTAYFKVYGAGSIASTESNLVTVNQAAAGQTVTYTLITDINDLTPGYHYLIAGGKTGTVQIMDKQTSNNRSVINATVDNGTITLNTANDYYDFVISGDATNNWTIYDEKVGGGYLYASSNGNANQLKTRAQNDDGNSEWSIEIANDGSVTMTAQGSNSKKLMRYNPNNGNGLFACYATNSSTGSLPCLFKKTTDTPVYYSPTEVTVNNPNTSTDPITVQNNEILELTGTVMATDPANLVIEDGGQLVFNNDNVQATMKKSTAHAGAKAVGDWYTIASPLAANVATDGVTHLTTGISGYDLYRYDEESSMWENIKAHGDFTQLEVGRGYLYWNADGVDIEFAGKLRNEAVTYNLTANGTGTYKGMNLIGNPFSQDITVSNITGATLTGGYVLSKAGAWSAEITEFKPCQGFLVQVDAAKTITISKSAAKSRANRNYIAFTVANSQYEDVTYAMFEEGLGLNKINHRNADIPMLYIAQNDENYAIATMSDETQSFNLNLRAMTTGQYTLSFKAEGKYDYLHVIDRLTGEDIDMLLDCEYSFIASPSDNDARFIVKLGYNTNNSAENDIFAFQNGNDIIVNGEGELQVFDVTGRMVATQHVNGVQTVNVPSQGVFIFKLNEKTQKIVVR